MSDPFWLEHAVVSTTTLPDLVSASEFYVQLTTELTILNRTVRNESVIVSSSTSEGVFESKIIIPLYIIIFVLSVVGNTLVLVTLIRDKRMRTVTNVYLLNLAVSDLLLGVFCMPFTLVGQVLRNFIFGSTMCKLIPYFQAVSVSVAVWTLVAISLERYFAICRPLKSRRWQTQFHAYKMIAFVWLASLFWSGPILIVSSLQAMKRGHKCREDWPSKQSEQIFNLFLDIILLLTPMAIMSIAYSMIVNKLWKGLQREIQQNSSCQKLMLQRSCSSPTINDVFGQNDEALSYSENGVTSHRTPQRTNQRCGVTVLKTGKKKEKKEKKTKPGTNEAVKLWLMKGFVQVRVPTSVDQRGTVFKNQTKNPLLSGCNKSTSEQYTSNSAKNTEQQRGEGTYTFTRQAIRSNFMDKSIEAKKKVIRMLFVIVAEFFICWAPLHILNTWYLFYPNDVYKYVGSTGVSLVQLLAYISSCCNPITYCFMNRRFKQAFIAAFNCWICCCKDIAGDQSRANAALLKMVANNSDVSCNDSTIFVGRASGLARSEVLVLDAEDRV